MKSNTAIAVLVSLLAGAIIGYSFKLSEDQTTVSGSPPVSKSDYDSGIRKLQDLSETEIAEYYRLKTLEERYAKADELLGKMMTIFLADLGIKLTSDMQTAMKEPLLVSTAPDAAPLTNAPKVAGSFSRAPIITKGIGASAGQIAAPLNRKSLEDVRSEEEIAGFLKASRPENFEDLVNGSKGYANNSGTIEDLQGTFTGSGPVVIDGEQKIWTYELMFNGRLVKGALKGSHRILISENGEVFNNSKGRGDLSDEYREISSDPSAILVAAGPKTFLQIYYLKSQDSLIGNVFRKSSNVKPYQNVGQFKLTR